jgi:hypothetical protein
MIRTAPLRRGFFAAFIVGSSRVMVSRVGIAVPVGAPKPDIGSADALRAALIGAKSIAYGQSASGRLFVSVICASAWFTR